MTSPCPISPVTAGAKPRATSARPGQSGDSCTQRAKSQSSTRSRSRSRRSAIRQASWCGAVSQPLITVQEMLENVVGGIADVGLRVDDEPRFACGRQDVLCVQVGAQQDALRGSSRQRAEQLDTSTSEADIKAHSPSCSLLFEFVGPRVAHDLQRPEAMTGHGFAPQSPQQVCDHGVLFRLRSPRQRSSRNAPLEQQRGGVVEFFDRVQSHDARSIPFAQPLSFVGRFVVAPRELQHELRTVGGADRRDPCRLTAGLKRLPCGQRPATLQLPDELRQSFEPRVTAITLHRDDEVPG